MVRKEEKKATHWWKRYDAGIDGEAYIPSFQNATTASAPPTSSWKRDPRDEW